MYRFAAALVFVIIILIEDIREYKIKNKTVLVFLILGIVINAAEKGMGAIAFSGAGMLVPLVLLPLFALNMLGAGDIKAFCALGAIFGARNVVNIGILSFLSAGAVGLVCMLLRKNGRERFRYLFGYLQGIFLGRGVKKYRTNTSERGGVFRFSYGIALGTILYMLSVICNIRVWF